MAVNEAGTTASAPVARFDLPDGTQLRLHRTCLVHHGGSLLETLPLAAVQSVRVGFARNARRLRWGIALAVLAVLLFALAGPLVTFAGGAAAEMSSGNQGVARALYMLFRVLEAVASLLPVLAVAGAIGGGALCFFGWRGNTVLEISLAGLERTFASRGRDAQMLEFAASVSERLMSLDR
jgi:hypothetical protein